MTRQAELALAKVHRGLTEIEVSAPIVPALYNVFDTLTEGTALIREEEDRSVTEELTHHA